MATAKDKVRPANRIAKVQRVSAMPSGISAIFEATETAAAGAAKLLFTEYRVTTLKFIESRRD